MNPRWLLLLLMFPACAAFTGGQPAILDRDDVVYSLAISEHRQEYKDAAYLDQAPEIVFDSDLTLFGRIHPRIRGGGDVLVYADSIVFDSRSPYLFSTFMAVDTMYYSARGGTVAINRNEVEHYDSMLICVFDGPALRVVYTETGAIRSVFHPKEHCPSGEYGRINLPVTMGFFMPDSAALHAPADAAWREHRPIPTFSGVGFHPRLEIFCRVVKTEGNLKTISVTADSTVTEYRTRMKNGEDVVILNGRYRLGGTIKTDAASGITQSGEIRIKETMELLRPSLSHAVIHKNCEYTIRLRTH